MNWGSGATSASASIVYTQYFDYFGQGNPPTLGFTRKPTAYAYVSSMTYETADATTDMYHSLGDPLSSHTKLTAHAPYTDPITHFLDNEDSKSASVHVSATTTQLEYSDTTRIDAAASASQ